MSKDKPIGQLMPDDVFNQAVGLFQQGYDAVAPYLRQLNATERKKALRLDAKKAAMMRKAPDYAASHSQFLSKAVTEDDLKMAVKNMDMAAALRRPIDLLQSQLDQTEMAVNSEGIQTNLGFYRNIQNAAANDEPDAELIAADLGQAFAGMGSRPAAEKPTSPALG